MSSETVAIDVEFLEEILSWMMENDYECGEQGHYIYKELKKLVPEKKNKVDLNAQRDYDEWVARNFERFKESLLD